MSSLKWIGCLTLCCLAYSSFADENGVRTTALKGTVALTFDDGPTEKYTPQILAILKKYNIKASFFMVGMNAKAHPDMVRLVLAAGHQINNHSMTHPMLTKLSDKQLINEITEPQTIIENIVHFKPVCLRYPYGASNSHVRGMIRHYGIVPLPMGWNSFDYDCPGVDKIVSNVLNYVRSGQVFLMHDGFDRREQTVAALPQIIEGIKKKGYGFSTICDDNHGQVTKVDKGAVAKKVP